MNAHRFYHEVIAGRKEGVGRIARLGLGACVPFYRAATGLRGLAFDLGWRRIRRVFVPVISVGNLTTGGTGKTPVVGWLIDQLQADGMRPGILSRGYRSLDDGGNDEKRLLDAMSPGVPHIQNPDRVAGAQQAVRDHDCNVLVLDDGFQHRRLYRDLDIVLIDAVNPWGYGHLLPRGVLREPRAALGRADVVIITRADLVDESTLAQLQVEIRQWTTAPVSVSQFKPAGWISACGETASLATLAGKRVAAFCGIGNPDGFARTLAGIGIPLSDKQWRIFPDHHPYTSEDLYRVNVWSESIDADCLVTTRKDLVKVAPLNTGSRLIWALEIALEIDDSEPVLTRLQAVTGRKRWRSAA